MNTQKNLTQLNEKKTPQLLTDFFSNIKIGRLTRMLSMHPLTSPSALNPTFDAAQPNASNVDGWQMKTVCCECNVHNCSICNYTA
jgi:hypothetical protein